ncbi:hypothetical protein SAMN06265339_0218 [Desulfurobacterium pacificum]|uniref:SH3b domain-containing protein n=1 Tax=Desulfurobacterium pacificum TaxID=240166 RepID=A0ABY1NA63_9BACT|nr:hypothetical protein [Desulfurobacterium pacificum]SMP04309.1 hypothetical protein SAMN06265339_0218 [Desulfurobacterium pacificum]
MRLLMQLFLLLLPLSAVSQEFTVLTDATSLRTLPDREEIVGTLSKGYSQPLLAKFEFWAKGENGWVNLDFADYFQPLFLKTGELTLKIFRVESGVTADTDNGTVYIPADSVIIVAKEGKDYVVGSFKGQGVKVSKSFGNEEEKTFDVSVLTSPVTLVSDYGYESISLKAGIPLLIADDGEVLYNGAFWTVRRENDSESYFDKEQLISTLNHLIDIYNSAKFSSPIAERLGYYVKTMPLTDEDVSLINTASGRGIIIRLKHRFFMNDGKPINDRKTRLILKKSNFDFWLKLAKSCFDNGINKFVEIEVYRYDPDKEGYDKQGFVAVSYHLYKAGKYDNYDDFLKYSDSDLNDDLWFFADEVYERIEDGN